MTNDPYHDTRVYHRANLFGRHGEVSALCFRSFCAIDPKLAAWTIIDEAVTCPKCLAAMKAKGEEK